MYQVQQVLRYIFYYGFTFPVCTLTLHLQSGRRPLHLGLLLQVMRRRELGQHEGLSSPRSIPPPRSPQSDIWPPDGSLGQGKKGPFWGGGVPTPQVFPEVCRGWLDVLSPNSLSSLASVSLRACRLHALPLLAHTTSFVVCLSIPPHPGPPHCQALERSRISVCFDYRGRVGDVSRAGRSPFCRVGVAGRQCVPAPTKKRKHDSKLPIQHTPPPWFCVFPSLGHFLPLHSACSRDPPTLSFLVCSCSSTGFRFGRLMELAQGSAAQGWGGTDI